MLITLLLLKVVEALRPHGLTLQNFASIREQTMGGFTQVGSHGSGATIPPVDEQVVSMKLVTPALGCLELSKVMSCFARMMYMACTVYMACMNFMASGGIWQQHAHWAACGHSPICCSPSAYESHDGWPGKAHLLQADCMFPHAQYSPAE